MLLQTFFPVPPAPEPRQKPRTKTTPVEEWPELQEEEIRRAIFNPNPKKAPGENGLSFYVWRQLWDVTKEWIVRLYRASLDLSYVPYKLANSKDCSHFAASQTTPFQRHTGRSRFSQR